MMSKASIVNKISVLVRVGTIVRMGSEIKKRISEDKIIDSKIDLLMVSSSILKDIMAMTKGKNKNEISQKSEEPKPNMLDPKIYNTNDKPKLRNRMKK